MKHSIRVLEKDNFPYQVDLYLFTVQSDTEELDVLLARKDPNDPCYDHVAIYDPINDREVKTIELPWPLCPNED